MTILDVSHPFIKEAALCSRMWIGSSVRSRLRWRPRRCLPGAGDKDSQTLLHSLGAEVVGALHQQPHAVDGDDAHDQEADGAELDTEDNQTSFTENP